MEKVYSKALLKPIPALGEIDEIVIYKNSLYPNSNGYSIGRIISFINSPDYCAIIEWLYHYNNGNPSYIVTVDLLQRLVINYDGWKKGLPLQKGDVYSLARFTQYKSHHFTWSGKIDEFGCYTSNEGSHQNPSFIVIPDLNKEININPNDYSYCIEMELINKEIEYRFNIFIPLKNRTEYNRIEIRKPLYEKTYQFNDIINLLKDYEIYIQNNNSNPEKFLKQQYKNS